MKNFDAHSFLMNLMLFKELFGSSGGGGKKGLGGFAWFFLIILGLVIALIVNVVYYTYVYVFEVLCVASIIALVTAFRKKSEWFDLKLLQIMMVTFLMFLLFGIAMVIKYHGVMNDVDMLQESWNANPKIQKTNAIEEWWHSEDKEEKDGVVDRLLRAAARRTANSIRGGGIKGDIRRELRRYSQGIESYDSSPKPTLLDQKINEEMKDLDLTEAQKRKFKGEENFKLARELRKRRGNQGIWLMVTSLILFLITLFFTVQVKGYRDWLSELKLRRFRL